jgi:hypothetical protein
MRKEGERFERNPKRHKRKKKQRRKTETGGELEQNPEKRERQSTN